MNLKTIAFLLGMTLLSTACLKTRSDAAEEDEKKVIQTQVNQLQKTKADQDANLQSYESQIRTLSGRVEVLEHQATLLSSQIEESNRKISESDERFKQLEQALLQVEQQGQQSVSLRPATNSEEFKKESKKKTAFDDAEEYYNQKSWKKAVVLYQKYRDKNPNGSEIALATFRIGNCFQEMKMNKEAKVFYEEVIDKHAKSKYAKLAQARLTQLKKK